MIDGGLRESKSRARQLLVLVFGHGGLYERVPNVRKRPGRGV